MWKAKSDEKVDTPMVVDENPPLRPINQYKEEKPMSDSAKVCSTISKNTLFKGEVTGENDVIVQGKIEGIVNLKDNTLIVSEGAKVSANIFVKSIEVKGIVNGDIEASDKVLITEQGRVVGNITAGKVVLNEGSLFKGSISMDIGSVKGAGASASTSSTINGAGAKMTTSSTGNVSSSSTSRTGATEASSSAK